MSKNLCAKTRCINEPYEIWRSTNGLWEWLVLKKYQNEENEKKNPCARWYCAVKSPFTYGSYEYGDVYVNEIKNEAMKVERS